VKATPVINGKENAGLALSETEEKILTMTTVAMHFENILVETGLEAKALSSLLFFLEMKGYIKQLPGQYYIAEIKN
jgi:DNA processing protein